MKLVARNGERLKLKLEIEDPRTEEEKTLDRQREADENTYQLPNLEPHRDGTSRPLRLPEEMANPSHSLFGPDLHFYRSLFFIALAMEGQL
jgi:hypothetical protein